MLVSRKSAVNLPLSADAAIRIVGAYEHVPGYIDRALPATLVSRSLTFR